MWGVTAHIARQVDKVCAQFKRSQAIKFTSKWNIFVEVINVTKVQLKASLKSTYKQ